MQGPGVCISCRPSGAAEAVACSIRSPTAMYRATQIHRGPTVSPGPPHLRHWRCGAQVLRWPCLPGGRFSPRAVCRLLSCLLTGRGRCVSTAGELAFAMWAPCGSGSSPLAAGLQLCSRHRAPCKAWAGVPRAAGMKSHPASSPLEGAGGGAAGVTFREAAGAVAGRSLSAPTPAHAAPQGSGDRAALPRGSRPVSAAPGTRSTRGTRLPASSADGPARASCQRPGQRSTSGQRLAAVVPPLSPVAGAEGVSRFNTLLC